MDKRKIIILDAGKKGAIGPLAYCCGGAFLPFNR